MPSGVYKHKSNQGFQKGNSVWTGKTLTEEHKAKLRKPKANPSHFKGRTYKDIYGEKWQEQIELRRLSRIAYHDAKGRNNLFKRPHHSGALYNRFTRLVFERDNFVCVLCGSKGELNADHYPESFNSICKRLNVRTMAEAVICDDLWNIDNGRTLCVNCHRKTHSYGWHEFSEDTRRKIGDASRKRKKERFSECHPERQHFCKGLCRQCYNSKYRDCHPKAKNVIVKRSATFSNCHPQEKQYCKGLCKSCYYRQYRKRMRI